MLLRLLLPIAFCVTPISSNIAIAQEQLPYSVGLAKVDITPDFPVRLSGFGGRRAESEGVTQRIWAKALAIQGKNQTPAVLITVDNLGIPAYMVEQVARSLHAKAKLPPERLAIAATHTHTAPMLKNVAPTLFSMPIPADHQERIDRYTAELTDQLEKVALAALAASKPSRLAYGIGTATFGMNRRTKGGPVDHDLPVLAVYGENDKLRAVYVTYACHCVTLSNNKISGDWAGFAESILEENHPGTIALVSVGCGADQNPTSGVAGDKVDLARSQGAEIATEVRRLLGGYLTPIAGELTTKVKKFELPLADLPTKEQWQAKAEMKGPIGYHAQVNLARLKRGEKIRDHIDYSVQTWSFGDSLAMVFLPGEVVVDYALRLKKELDGRRLWLNAYANDAPCYIPSERVLKEGGYEGGGAMVYYDLPVPFRPGLEEKIVAAARELAGPHFASPIDFKKCNIKPMSPQQSLATIQTRKGVKMELVVAEPLISSPVAIDFGPAGKLWVAEMADYPLGAKGNYEPGGRIKLLEKTAAGRKRAGPEHDARYDKATVFLDNIPFPTGVTAYGKGVLICAAPDILYAEDTDGDGKADVVKKLFTGFGTGNYQARVNSLEWGLDGWIYGSCGLFGGTITSHTGKVVKLGDRDFRIKPDEGIIEPATGRTQQGRVRDDWDNWFGCDNSTLCRHYPLADHYLRRNPHVPQSDAAVYVPDYPDSNRLHPIAKQQLFKLSGPPGRVTAACGLGIYRDDLLGKEFSGNAFVCEPVNNAVHRLVLSPKGSTFSGRRAPDEQSSEFLASTDIWFRPVQARTGPDGALWIVDMYRYVIEHPRWIPPDDVAKLDLRAGSTMGRIYRVVSEGASSRAMSASLPADMSIAELVAALSSANGPLRDQASQLLIGANDPKSPPLLEQALSHSEATARMHALCVLDGLHKLQAKHVTTALSDSHPGVRRQAVRLAAAFLGKSDSVDAELTKRIDDLDAQVRLQLAYTLGQWRDPHAGKLLSKLAVQDNDVHLTAAILSSLRADNLPVVMDAVAHADKPPALLAPRLAAMVAAVGDRALVNGTVQRLLTGSRPSASQIATLAALLDALDRRGSTAKGLVDSSTEQQIREALSQSRRRVLDETIPETERVANLLLLGRDTAQRKDDLAALGGLLTPQTSSGVQSGALTALGRFTEPEAMAPVVAAWRGLTPALKTQGLDLLLSRPIWQQQLLAGIHAKKIAASDVDPARRQRLLASKNKKTVALASEVFAGAAASNRQQVLDDYRLALKLPGDAKKGHAIFQKHCSVCHRLFQEGHAVGPDLAAVVTKPADYLLIEILDPSRNLDSRYVEYVAMTTNGRTFTGLLAAETATSITLRGQEGKQQELLRSELEELSSTGRSLMPEGLEKEISPQAMADLLAFLASAATQSSGTVVELAKLILDDNAPSAKRQAAIADNIGRAAELLQEMTRDLQPGTKEEYRRIPWIWRVAIAAGKRNDADQLHKLLDVSLPKKDEPLRDWQAVVVGGGVINGISLVGIWPEKRVGELFQGDDALQQRWRRALAQAAAMADNAKVPTGTRYDALRMIALDAWENCGERLAKHLGKEAHAELQMGAVSGLADIDRPEAAKLLLDHLSDFNAGNRKLALDALVKTDDRAAALVEALEQDRVSATLLTKEQKRLLLERGDEALKRRVRKLLASP
jgi:putative membrane-bound dehydrogenase-like protein